MVMYLLVFCNLILASCFGGEGRAMSLLNCQEFAVLHSDQLADLSI